MDTIASALLEILTPEAGWSAQLVVRVTLSTVLLFTFILVLARTFGTRTFASFTSYDFLTNVAAGSLVASAILGRSIVEASLALLVLVLLQFVVSGGILVERGVIQERAMRRARVSRAILDQHVRQAGLDDVGGVRLAVLESGGSISVLTG